MEHIKHYILLAATLLLASCSQDEEFANAPHPGTSGEWVEITVGTPQGKDSRVSYDDNSVTPFAWENGDQIIAVGFDETGNYKGQELFTLKGEITGNKNTATFQGKTINGADRYKLYYKAAQLVISTTDGTATIDYSKQAEDVTHPTAHMKDYYRLATPALLKSELFDVACPKNLELENSMLRIEVKSVPAPVGVTTHIKLITNSNTDQPKELSMKLTGVTENQAFKVYMMFDPASMAQQQGNSFGLVFTGTKMVENDPKPYQNIFTATALNSGTTLNKSGIRYNLVIAKEESEITTGKGVTRWAPEVSDKVIWIRSLDGYRVPSDYISQGEGWAKRESSTTITEMDASLQGAGGLKGMWLPPTIEKISDYAFRNSALEYFGLPENLKSIGTGAFQGCSFIKDIVIPEGVTIIEDNTFDGCWELSTVIFHDNITSIGNEVFKDCWHLSQIKLPANLENIGSFTFQNCRLATLTIPEKVKTIGEDLYYGCPPLTELRILCPSVDGFARFALGKGENTTLYLNPTLFNLVEGNNFFGRTWKEILPIGEINNDGVGFDDIIKDEGSMF